MRFMEEYRSMELFKTDLQSNLRKYVSDATWQIIKPKHPLPWDYSDMVVSYRKYTQLASPSPAG
jgi:hypothetical protein